MTKRMEKFSILLHQVARNCRPRARHCPPGLKSPMPISKRQSTKKSFVPASFFVAKSIGFLYFGYLDMYILYTMEGGLEDVTVWPICSILSPTVCRLHSNPIHPDVHLSLVKTCMPLPTKGAMLQLSPREASLLDFRSFFYIAYPDVSSQFLR